MQRVLVYEDLAKERRLSHYTPVQAITCSIHGNHNSRLWNTAIDGELSWCCFKQIMTHTAMEQESTAAAIIRACKDVHAVFAMHPTVDIIRISGFTYAVIYNHNVAPTSLGCITSLYNHSIFALHKLHFSNAIMLSFHPDMCFHGSYTLNDKQIQLLRHTAELKSFKAFKETNNYSSSPFLSPLQIVLEMLSSSVEPELIDYKYFKAKLLAFWGHMCLRFSAKPYKEWATQYFAHVAGAVDYMDFIVNRYCIVTPCKDGLQIKKDKSRALGYITDIDLFALAISIRIFADDKGLPISNTLKTYLGECIRGNYVGDLLDDEALCEIVKPFPIIPAPLPAASVIPITSAPPILDTPSIPSPPPSVPSTNKCQPIANNTSDTPPPSATTQPVINTETSSVNNTESQLNIVHLSTDPPISGEISVINGAKKIKIQGIERIVRNDTGGDYVVWKGSKLYILA